MFICIIIYLLYISLLYNIISFYYKLNIESNKINISNERLVVDDEEQQAAEEPRAAEEQQDEVDVEEKQDEVDVEEQQDEVDVEEQQAGAKDNIWEWDYEEMDELSIQMKEECMKKNLEGLINIIENNREYFKKKLKTA